MRHQALQTLTGMFYATPAHYMLTRGPRSYGTACLTAFAAVQTPSRSCLLGMRVDKNFVREWQGTRDLCSLQHQDIVPTRLSCDPAAAPQPEITGL